jgi:ABC-type nitrate/sulfonate/bicarbonate transport system substrate-binding protein
LLAGAVDLTPLELPDALRITTAAPERVRVLLQFADDLPEMVFTGIHANRAFARSNPDVVVDYLRALLTVHDQIRENPDLLVQKASEALGEDAIKLNQQIKTYLAGGFWRPDGHFNPPLIDASLRFFESTGDLEPGLTANAVADWHYLEKARAPRE